MRAELRLLFLGLSAIVLVHCAKGSSIIGSGLGGGGEGASEGASSPGGGGSQNTGGDPSTGGNPMTGGATSAGGSTGGSTGSTSSSSGSTSSSSGSTTSSSSSSSSTTSSSSSSTTSSSSSSTTSSSSSTTSSSSSTTSSSSSGTTSSTTVVQQDCQPMTPAVVCGAGQHCFPEPNGVPICQGPVGAGSGYSACNTPSDCQAALQCVDTGDIFGSPCCLKWCTSAANCLASETCEFLNPAVYVGATEYGVCYDGLGGC